MSYRKSNRRRAALETGYITPEIIDPPETLCVCVPVPDEPRHRAAFLGQMMALARWYTWQKDDEHTGREVAAVWDAIFWDVRDQMALQKRNCGCGCADETQQRLNPDGTIEVSTDGGTTWTPLPASQDPRQNGSYLPAPPNADTDDGKCEMANSLVAALKQDQAELYGRMSLGAGAAELAALFIAFLVAVGVIATGGALAIFGAAIGALLTSFDATAWNALFVDELWADLLCEVKCAISDDGSISQADALAIGAQIYASHPDRAGQFIRDVLTAWGAVGATNAARIGIDGALDCDDCDCPAGCVDPSWIVVGTFVSMDATSITIDSAFSAGYGQNMVVYGSDTTGEFCCYFASLDVISGSGPSGYGYIDCDGTPHALSPILTTAGEGQFGFGGAAGRIKLTFS